MARSLETFKWLNKTVRKEGYQILTCKAAFNLLPAEHEIKHDLTQAERDYGPLALPAERSFVMLSTVLTLN
jgi:hypothetical protein